MSYFKKLLAMAMAFLGLGATQAMAVPVAVDLTEATTSVGNAGSALIGLAIVMLGLTVVYSFIKKRA